MVKWSLFLATEYFISIIIFFSLCFKVIASDQGVFPQSASASVIINVQDVNDNDPVFEPDIYEAVVAEDDSPGNRTRKFSDTIV